MFAAGFVAASRLPSLVEIALAFRLIANFYMANF
jgi:hypothetical protein